MGVIINNNNMISINDQKLTGDDNHSPMISSQIINNGINYNNENCQIYETKSKNDKSTIIKFLNFNSMKFQSISWISQNSIIKFDNKLVELEMAYNFEMRLGRSFINKLDSLILSNSMTLSKNELNNFNKKVLKIHLVFNIVDESNNNKKYKISLKLKIINWFNILTKFEIIELLKWKLIYYDNVNINYYKLNQLCEIEWKFKNYCKFDYGCFCKINNFELVL